MFVATFVPAVGGAKANGGGSRPEALHFPRGGNPHAFVSRGILVALFNGNVKTARARDAHLRGLISNPDRAKANGTLPACLPAWSSARSIRGSVPCERDREKERAREQPGRGLV